MSEVRRLRWETVGIVSEGGREMAIRIPDGAILRLQEPLDAEGRDGTRRVTVDWNGTKVSLFAVDLRFRAERVGSGSSPDRDREPDNSLQ